MEFNSILDTVLWIMFWYFIANFLLSMLNARLEAKLNRMNKIRDKFEKVIHAVKIEQHHETYYWFDNDSLEFLAQGKDINEIRSRLLERFNGHIFIVNETEVWAGPNLEVHATEAGVPNRIKIDV